MDFNAFRNSNFFKLGMKRINTLTLETTDTYFSMFDSGIIDPLSKIQNNDLVLEPPMGHSNITIAHVLQAIQTQLPARHGVLWIPEEFKNVLRSQLIEVNQIVNDLLILNNAKRQDNKIGMIHSKLLITEPGVSINKHIHQCPFTLTVCYKFNQDSIEGEPSHFMMGETNRKPCYYPKDDKFYFVMRDDPPHEVFSNEWRFWWFNDFSEVIDIPDLGFTRWSDPLLDNNNLDSKR
jgi:hypothetical protein